MLRVRVLSSLMRHALMKFISVESELYIHLISFPLTLEW